MAAHVAVGSRWAKNCRGNTALPLCFIVNNFTVFDGNSSRGLAVQSRMRANEHVNELHAIRENSLTNLGVGKG